MCPRQQFRAPGRNTAPRVQQRHLGFPPVERRVQRRQVGDLQRDDHQTGRRGQEHDHRRHRSGWHGEAQGEQRGPGVDEGGHHATGGERPQHEGEPDIGNSQPYGQLEHQDRRCLRGEQPVTVFVFGDVLDRQVVGTVDNPVHVPCQPAGDQPRHNQRPDDAGTRQEHKQAADNRGRDTPRHWHHHGVLLLLPAPMAEVVRISMAYLGCAVPVSGGRSKRWCSWCRCLPAR